MRKDKHQAPVLGDWCCMLASLVMQHHRPASTAVGTLERNEDISARKSKDSKKSQAEIRTKPNQNKTKTLVSGLPSRMERTEPKINE